jgi:hypothetical protein
MIHPPTICCPHGEIRYETFQHTCMAMPNQGKTPAFIEMGAGTGYLAHCLKHAGSIVSSYDSSPLPFLPKRYTETNQHTNTKRSNSPKNSSNKEYHGSSSFQCNASHPQPCQTHSTLRKEEARVQRCCCATHHREMTWVKTRSEPISSIKIMEAL